jgi:protein-S-isoprenylcysteine O-methyltransferase Ste14
MPKPLLAVASLVLPVVLSVLYFGAAGRLDLPASWAIVAVLVLFGLVMSAWGDRGLMAERVSPGGPNRNRLGQRVASVLLLTHWVLSGLDAGRLGWTPVPMAIRWAGVAGYAVAMALLLWAVQVNRFYSSVVRVQADRGQVTVEAGPYGVVRHPGYAATILGALTGGVALGSWIGMVPLLAVAVLFVHRMQLEDAMLRAELPGYSDYAGRVRYRLVPGLY